MIARPIRRTGPIPFAPFPPLAERPLMAAPRETRDVRETRMRSRWLPTPHAGHPVLPPSQPSTQPPAQQAQRVLIQAARHEGGTSPSATSTSACSGGAPSSSTATASTARSPRGGCHAVYHGQGTLSVLSSITGHHYRFEGRGCTLTIDPRDRLVLGRLNELSIHSA